jgi:predicted dehydrogenase
MGLVGGGPGSFVGPVHRMAAELDGRIRLVAGAFSSDPQRSLDAARRYGVSSERSYSDYREMFRAERAREDGIDLVAIATPNHLHLPVALAALDVGLHVVCEKPATSTLSEALILREAVRRSDRLYALTYTYSGYAMVREARARVARGDLGRVRKIVVDYPQGWLSTPVERAGNKQAQWRADVSRAGAGGCIGDIGVHAFHLAEYVSGMRVTSLMADLSRIVPDRTLDDDCNVLLRFSGGQPGVLMASQISAGERNGLTLRIHGEMASVHWHQETPNVLRIEHLDGRTELFHAGSTELTSHSRLPPGHPEGFIEALANLYEDVAAALSGAQSVADTALPGIDDGVRGMRFVEQAITSSAEKRWVTLDTETPK